MELANHGVQIVEAAIKAGGEESYDLPRLLTRRSMVELAAGDLPNAEADATRAIALLKTELEPGESSSHLGYAYLALARALQARSKAPEPRAAFQAAADNLEATTGTDHPDFQAAQQLLLSFRN